jgi:hypothetical protein
MSFGGGGSGALPNHEHTNIALDGGPLDFVNTTIASLSASSMTYSDGAALQELTIGSDAQVLAVQGGAPTWITNTSNPLVKVTKTFADISGLEMDIYSLPLDSALVNVWVDITTVFDVSTGVTIGDAGNNSGWQQATDWTSGTGLTDATRGAYVTNFKTMRSTSGTTAIKAYNFSTTGGGGSTFSQLSTDNNENLYPPTGRTEVGQSYQTGQVLIGEDVCKASFFIRRVGSTTGTLRAYVRDTTGVLVATSSTTIDASTLTTGYVEHEFLFSDVEILNNYMITLNSDDLLTGQVDMESLNADIPNGLCYMKIAGVWSQIITAALKMNVEYACTPVTGDTQGEVDFYLQVVD